MQMTHDNFDNFDDFPPMMLSLKEVVKRHQWGARLPRRLAAGMRYRIGTVVFLYADTDRCTTTEECSAMLRDLQDYHMYKQNLFDIPYSFMLGGDLRVYEGRGWNTCPPVPTEVEEKPFATLVIAYLGHRPDLSTRVLHLKEHDYFPQELRDFTRGYEMIQIGILKGFIDPSFDFQRIHLDWNKYL